MKRLLVFLLAAVGCFGQPIPIQTIYEALATDLEVVPSILGPVQNVGQTGHTFLLSFEDNPPNNCTIGAFAPALDVLFEVSYDNIAYFSLSNITAPRFSGLVDDAANGRIYSFMYTIQGYPYLRLRVRNFDIVDCQLDAFYTGGTYNANAAYRAERFRVSGGVDGYDDEFVSFIASWDGNNSLVAGATYTYNGDSADDAGRGGWDRLLDCAHSIVVNIGAVATTEVIALVADQTIHVCSVDVSLAAAGTFALVTGTGANCAVGQANLTAGITLAVGVPLSLGGNLGRLANSPDSEALCVTTTGVGATAEGIITYAQYVTDQTPQ